MISSPGSTVVESCRVTMYSHQITGVPRDKTQYGTNRSAQGTKQECSHQQEYRGTQTGPIENRSRHGITPARLTEENRSTVGRHPIGTVRSTSAQT
ncbi:unnamed protein product [Linum trigynum]|uniref:Uncharacterized protein n=1 Tax=Linum trigynum TaxID=586398 RepID=A0AAV2GL47_9ROSI